jgi:hypothetical protein
MGRIRPALSLGVVLAAACGLICAAGCTKTADPLGPFSVVLTLDQSAGSFCPSENCADYGMSCGAVIAIGMLDTEMGNTPVVDECETLDAADSICGLRDISQMTFYSIPPHRLRISVAAWRPGVLPDDKCPNEDIFNDRGFPKDDFFPRPAFARSIVFDAGSDDDRAELALSCPDPQQLDQEECNVDTIRVEARVDDMVGLLDLTSERARELDVGAAAPRMIPGTPGGNAYVIDNSNTVELDFEDGAVPSFVADVDDPIGTTVCTVVDDSAPQSTAAASCADVDAEDDPLELRGVLLETETLDAILTAMASPGFPDDGLVVGRVVDHTGVPLAGVTLATDGDSTIGYLSDDLQTLTGGGATTTSGYFVSTDAAFGSRWTAVSGDGRREEGAPRAGLVREKVSTLIVRMEPP